ncbi:ABC transporter ATP-binding protein [Ktedonospora formicarum]|uniref:ABC transporter permease n=1 Tax=Ktedonospora formicarum TaxID=2778364 RepID=A0A8J3I1P5_9CHLR|nr:ABC transporter ATP-binding protein [Ktedonospora formicarum]GHO45976.1 ABC transporter permease [Ktedonospora formicarum]
MEKLHAWLRVVRELLQTIQIIFRLLWKSDRGGVMTLLVLEVVQALVPVGAAWLSKVLFDTLVRGVQQQNTATLLSSLLPLLALQTLVVIAGQVITPTNKYVNEQLSLKLTFTMKCSIYQKLNSLAGLAHFEDPRFHDMFQIANTAHFMPKQTLSSFLSIMRSLLTFLSVVGIFFILSPLLALVIAIATIPHLYIHLRLSKEHVQMRFENNPKERQADYYGRILSTPRYAKEVKLFQLGPFFLQSFLSLTKVLQLHERKHQKREWYWQLGLSALAALISSGAFIVVVMQAFARQISIGDVALYIGIAASVQQSLLVIAFSISQINEYILYFKRYNDLQALPQTISLHRTPQRVPILKKGITFQNVSFRYTSQHPWILKDVNLFLPAHQCLALVGLNGAGKSTLVKLLTRMYDPSAGEILWDGIDIREFDVDEYRGQIGAIFQDFSRYDLSAQENIGLGNTTHMRNSDLIQNAANKAGIHERIMNLPQGYESILSLWMAGENQDNGIDLSGGEWQKVALARMFMRSSSMLILDEPTAALDAEAEYELYAHFQELMRGHTSLLITHRFSTVRMADHVAVLDGSQIVEYGTHDNLLALQGQYARMYNMQAQSYLSDNESLNDVVLSKS